VPKPRRACAEELAKLGQRRAVAYLGMPPGGEVYLVRIREGLSNFGAPTPEALDQCVEGLGKYAKRLDPPYTLRELLEELPPDLRQAAAESRCVKYAFYTSRVDPTPLRRGVYAVGDPVLFYNLGRYLPLYVGEDCERGTPTVAGEVELRVMEPLEFLHFFYKRELAQTAKAFLWRVPQLVLRMGRRWGLR